MTKKELATELIDFCFKYRLLNISNKRAETVDNVEANLGKIEFVERLIHMLIAKTKIRKNIDKQKLKKLLLELEEIRLDLEYGNQDKQEKEKQRKEGEIKC